MKSELRENKIELEKNLPDEAATDEIRQSEERYRLLVNAVSDVLWTTDAEGRVSDMPQWRAITGQTQAEVEGWGWLDALHPEDRQTTAEVWRRAVETRSLYDIEYRIRQAGGGYRSYLARGVPVIEKDGGIREWVGVCIDIENQKQAEAELKTIRRELETRVEARTEDLREAFNILSREINERERVETEQQIISSIIQSVATTADLDELLELVQHELRKAIYAENFYVALYDKVSQTFSLPFFLDQSGDAAPAQPNLGRGATAYVFRSNLPALFREEDFQRLIEAREFEQIGTLPAVWMGVPLRTSTETIGVLAVQHYTEAAVYAERDLQFLSTVGDQIAIAIERKYSEEIRQRLVAMIEATPDLVAMVNTHRDLVYLNKAGREMLGIGETEDISQISFTAKQPLWVDKLMTEEIIPKLLRHRSWSGETAFYDGRGTEIATSQVILAHKNFEGQTDVFSTIARDITESKRISAELAATRDAALESTRLKSEFLANMSHEIRTPMNGVLGMTGLLLDTDLQPEQHEFALDIQKSADSLLNIINDILDFSKIEAGMLNFEKIGFDLREPIEGSVQLLAERAADKNLVLTVQIDGDVPPLVKGDPGRLRQIVTNLVSNAVKFTKTGEVAVRVGKEQETKSHLKIRVEVRDTGIGIHAGVQQNLFRAFIQADSSTTRKYGGSGLGLAISKQLAEMMNGEIGVESEFGKGSVFWFTAKFEKQKTPETVKSAPSLENAAEGLRVLIVDENAAHSKIIAGQLKTWKMITAEAHSGAAALHELRQAARNGKPYDLVILDLLLPEFDGIDLARLIKSDPEIARVKLVLLLAHGYRGQAETARQTGIDAYLIKPVRPSQLYNCLLTVAAQTTEDAAAGIVTQYNLRTTEAAPVKPQTAIADALDVRKNYRILLAEDNELNQKVASNQLKNLGFQADVVNNGREAVNAVAEKEYDLILMDCQMPELDGYEATAAIRRRENGGKKTIIVALTAHAMEGEMEKCLAAGMDDYLSKPVKTETLRQLLERWLLPKSN